MKAAIGSTYRLQLRPGFGFEEAASLAPYLASLGVELAYLSPIAEARPQSTHGYDVTDPTRIRRELGGESGFAALADALFANGIGIMVDIVPNHMSTWPGGLWWRDVLKHGRDSPFAKVFDIDWEWPPSMPPGKVSLPALDGPAEAAAQTIDKLIAARHLFLSDSAGELVLILGDLQLPVSGEFDLGDDPHDVLACQNYRLIAWQDFHTRNYRRFFDIDDLVGVNQEDPEVFALTHSLVADLAREGTIQAVRVDHIDGLADPAGYLDALCELTGSLPIVVEKILTGNESLRADWAAVGTTGYEVLDDISGALVDPNGLESLRAQGRIEGEPDVRQVLPAGKELVVTSLFPGEIERIAALTPMDHDELAKSVTSLPVYRTYLAGSHPDPIGKEILESALQRSLKVGLYNLPFQACALRRFQQLTAAVMAKGVEDTAFYRLPSLMALCEVGGDPGLDRHDGVYRFHRRALERASLGYNGITPGMTHDTKRSSDARARLLALACLTARFHLGLRELGQMVRTQLGIDCERGSHPGGITTSELRLLATTALVMLPCAVEPAESDQLYAELTARLEQVAVKSAREAKLNTSWAAPNAIHEAAIAKVARFLLQSDAGALKRAFGGLIAHMQRLGATISLSQVVLRSMVPGSPDCYQGDETWAFSLMDPDNRRKVDFAKLSSMLSALGWPPAPGDSEPLRRAWRNGLVKLHVTRACLAARRSFPQPFAPDAGYLPLSFDGVAYGSPNELMALARTARSSTGYQCVCAVVTRLPAQLQTAPDDLPAGERSFGGRYLQVPRVASSILVDALTGRYHRRSPDCTLDLSEVLAELPVAVLVPG